MTFPENLQWCELNNLYKDEETQHNFSIMIENGKNGDEQAVELAHHPHFAGEATIQSVLGNTLKFARDHIQFA